MPRAQPQWRWKYDKDTVRFRLGRGQRERLASIVEPEVISKLERAIHTVLSKNRPPRPAEVRAALEYGSKHAAALLRFVSDADEITQGYVARGLAPPTFEGGFQAGLEGLSNVQDQLQQLHLAILAAHQEWKGRSANRYMENPDDRMVMHVVSVLETCGIKVTKTRGGQAEQVLDICLSAIGSSRADPFRLLYDFLVPRKRRGPGQ